MQKALDLTQDLQVKLWSGAVAAAREDHDEVTTGYYIETLNGLIDDHSKRVTAPCITMCRTSSSRYWDWLLR
jgi:hypothetical protein